MFNFKNRKEVKMKREEKEIIWYSIILLSKLQETIEDDALIEEINFAKSELLTLVE